MKVHHLNCGSMRLPTIDLICHVLLIETDSGLVLVDTGHGLRDAVDPAGRLGPARRFNRPSCDPAVTAAKQVEHLGFRRDDVRHIVMTHLDSDHAGGLADFPDARVHLTAAELRGAVTAPTWRERPRFRTPQWSHGPKFVQHTPSGEPWRGFAAAQELTEISPGLVLIAMPGHTRGHAAVAVDAGHRWILHCGDAFLHRGTVDGATPVPMVVKAMESMLTVNRRQVRDNHSRLAELYRRADPDLLLISAHDPVMFEHARATADR
ncbi:MBL fold metallo-hydrolase [Nocardia sp. NPDC127579]|uniref:MBL fold metallo-hydrolase n=1 Tax=Nocardia sp. NPDC127579 TaxID=3345402 RepID=UPI00363EF6ED